MHMIEHGEIPGGLRLAKKTDTAFYKRALIKAGDITTVKSGYNAVNYYKEAGVKDPYLHMGKLYLNEKTLNLHKAEKLLKQSGLKNYMPLLLAKAIEKNNTELIARYAAGAKGAKMHESIGLAMIGSGNFDQAYEHFKKAGLSKQGAGQIAVKTEKQGKTDSAARYFYVAGKKEKAAILFRKHVQETVKKQTFVQDYIKWEAFPKGLMSVYWKEAMTFSGKLKHALFKQEVFKELQRHAPVLAAGYLHNHLRGNHLRNLAAEFAKAENEFSIASGQRFMDMAELHFHFNKLLETLLKEKKLHPEKNQKGIEKLRKAQEAIVDKNFKRCSDYLREAKALFTG